jgi:DNA-binding winged helix-turn-helix (wHTH) protein/WD40 repeat protein
MSLNTVESNELFEFGPFRLDLRARLLFRDGVPVPLAPKSFETLTYLVRNAGRAVSREELLGAVWPDVVVSDASLTQAVFLLRKALGETEDGPRYVETVPRTGYRFLTTVATPPAVSPAPLPHPPAVLDAASARPPRWSVPAALLATLVLAAGLALYLRTPPPVRPGAAAGRTPLLSLRREMAVPGGTTRPLGVVDSNYVLQAPGAFYLLPTDGALAATRIALAPRETIAGLVGDSLILVADGRLVARHAVKQTARDLGPLPEGIGPVEEGRLFVSPDGRFLAVRGDRAIDLLEIREGRVEPKGRIAADRAETEALSLSSRVLALAPGRGAPLRVFAVATTSLVLEVPFPEQKVFTLALDDAGGRVALGGPFDSVSIYSIGGGPPTVVPRRGWTWGLTFVPDVPTLLIAGFAGVAAWRPADGLVAALEVSSPGGGVVSTIDGVLALSPEKQRLAVLSYDGLPPSARIAAGGAPFWAITADATGRTVFAGGRDGRLHAVDTATATHTSFEAHTDGIPSMLRDGDLLATSSDDKTVAVWQLPGPRLLRRTRAHTFLVNDLQVASGPDGSRELVTASSDGTVKRWGWPGLDERESLDVSRLVGQTVDLHALWVAPGGGRILAGTWNHALVDLVREQGRWTARRLPVRSGATYRMAGLPAIGAVAVVGLFPSEVQLFDLSNGALARLESAGLDAFWGVAGPGGDELWVVGLGGALRYSFAREPGAPTRYRLWSRRQSFADLQTGTLLPDGSLWAGTADGAMLRLDTSAFAGVPLVVGEIESQNKD